MGKSYEAKDITVLEGLEPVKKNPAMWIGSVDKRGVHHLLWEILDNAVDEVINGYATTVELELSADRRTVTVSDNGRGIPPDLHPRFKKSALELVFCTLHAGGKFDDSNYFHSGGLHGVGSSVVNALSEKLVATVKRSGDVYRQAYRRGKPTGPVAKQAGKSRGSGTEVTFTPDPGVFADPTFDPRWIAERLEAKAFIHKGMRAVFRDLQTKETRTFQQEGGIADYLARILERTGKKRSHEQVFHCSREVPESSIRWEAAVAWTDSTDTEVKSFANGIYTGSGGTHETGLKSGLVKAVKNVMESGELVPRGVKVGAEDIREGVVAVLSVYLKHPQFQGQTKERLNNTDLTALLDTGVRTAVEQFFHGNPTAAAAVAQRVVLAARARAASREASEKVTRGARAVGRAGLPAKLADCSSNDPQESELFIVEGDSAGGNAKQARDRRIQAVLPIRGKVLNVEQATAARILDNKELSAIVSALGCGAGEGQDPSRLRYHKVCLLMDADSDGNHITTLLLTFFYRHLRELFVRGHVYLCQPPLYKITLGNELHWVADDEARERLLAKANGHKVDIQRFKGLGEMNPDELARTTMSPKGRTLLRVVIDDPELTEQTVGELMGKDPASRFRFIMERAGEAHAEELDI